MAEITYTTSGSAVFTESFAIDLYAGTPTDDETWLTSYPGALTSFAARQTDGSNTLGLKLVCGKFTTVLANAETVTLTGGATKIIAVLVGATSVANAGVDLTSISAAGVAAFTVVGAPGANVTAWMIVA